MSVQLSQDETTTIRTVCHFPLRFRKCANKNNDMSLQQEGVSVRGVSDAGAAASPSTVDEMTPTQREGDSTSPDSDITVSPKRRRVQTGSR